jgi:hypothetical protein
MGKWQLVTGIIAKKWFSGMRSSSSASISLYLESDVPLIPFQAIFPSNRLNFYALSGLEL